MSPLCRQLIVERVGQHIFIDTGSYKAGRPVTVVEPATGREWQG